MMTEENLKGKAHEEELVFPDEQEADIVIKRDNTETTKEEETDITANTENDETHEDDPIRPKKEDSSDRSVNWVIYGLFIGFAIIVVFIYANVKTGFVVEDGPYSYNFSNGEHSFKVTKVQMGNYPGYQVEVFFKGDDKPYLVDFRNDPKSLRDIKISNTVKNRILNDDQVYITIDPEQNMSSKVTLAALEIDKILDNPFFFNLSTNSAVTSPYQNMTVKTCDDASSKVTVIWLKLGNDTRVYPRGGCTIIEGETEDDIIRAADRFAYLLLGVMRVS